MNGGAVGPPQSEIEARAALATSGSADRRKRAMTVSPDAIREVDEEAAARRVGRERQAEQSALAAGEDDRAQVEEVAGLHRSVAHDSDSARLLDDELDAAIELDPARTRPVR